MGKTARMILYKFKMGNLGKLMKITLKCEKPKMNIKFIEKNWMSLSS